MGVGKHIPAIGTQCRVDTGMVDREYLWIANAVTDEGMLYQVVSLRIGYLPILTGYPLTTGLAG
jgi:hypothetical protein